MVYDYSQERWQHKDTKNNKVNQTIITILAVVPDSPVDRLTLSGAADRIVCIGTTTDNLLHEVVRATRY